jgi:para-nitrobenzyl esterase
MKKLYVSLLLATITYGATAQCAGNRYTKQIFSTVNVTSDVLYGSNYSSTGVALEDLLLDVYEPSGDTETMRPLLILEHGGSFILGSKEDGDVASLSEDFAKMGYVCSSISYRLGIAGFPFSIDSVGATEAVVRAYHDMKAAIRFFWKDARENGNTYGIDTNNIFIGGSSAGGFAAVHVAYLDELSEMPAYVDTTQAGLGGGLEGNSGNPGYPSEVKGVINLAGALRDTAWIKPGDLPLLSMHSTNDGTVPYGTSIVSVMGISIGLLVSGSSDIHNRLNDVGVTNCFYSVDGTAHPVHNGSAAYYDTTVMYMRNFLSSYVCATPLDCFGTDGIVGLDEVKNEGQIKIYPNPAKDMIYIDFIRPSAAMTNIQIIDVLGNIVATTVVSSTSSQIDVSSLSPGAYLFVCNSKNWQSTKRFIKK